MFSAKPLPRGFLGRLKRSRKRLDVLERQVIVTPARAEELGTEAQLIRDELTALADAVDGTQRGAIKAMADHARALERRYTAQSSVLYDE